MISDLSALTWPVADLGNAIAALARKNGLALSSTQIPNAPLAAEQGREALNRWLQAAAASLGVEAEPVTMSYETVDQSFYDAGPTLVCLPDYEPARFLVLIGGNRRTVSLLGPDLSEARLRTEVIRDVLCHSIDTLLTPEIDALIGEANIPQERQGKVRAAMLRLQLRGKQVGDCWLLRLPPSSSFWLQLRQAHLPQFLVLFASTYTVEYILWIFAWWLVGRAALSGSFDRVWLFRWGGFLLTVVPFMLLTTWLQGVIAIGAGVLFKQRLLQGALRLPPEEIRRQGVGQFLGRVIESEAVESLALNGGFMALAATIELVVSTLILGAAVGILHVFLLLGWISITLAISRLYFVRRQYWTKTRMRMTDDLVERMVGHRTCLVQELREQRQEEEKETLRHYLETSQQMDRAMTLLMAFAPRGWLVLGLLAIAHSFQGGYPPAAVAIALGGMLLAYRALRKLAASLGSITEAAIAWQQVAELFESAARHHASGLPISERSKAPESVVKGRELEACDLVFSYPDRSKPVLRGCNLSIASGERVLLDGASGCGKSTLVSLLTGTRLPHSGLLLLNGLDRDTEGEDAWRRGIVSAPQFHENHVLTGTFAFNLLMGRTWPPRPEDLQEAEAICRELGLGELLDRMPAGLLQMLGETGWQLSHGELNRLYIARTLLQGSDVTILDESFTALDPENLRRSLNCVLRRTRTLMVVAHP